MKKLFVIATMALLTAVIWTGMSTTGMPVTTRPLLQFFDHIDVGEISREDLLAERYFTMVDENGYEILVTGRKIHVGDEYITGDNRLYRVYRVTDRIAHARYIREVGAVFAEEPSGLFVMLRQWLSGATTPVQTEPDEEKEEEPEGNKEGETDEDPENGEEEEEEEGLEPEEAPRGVIGIYHTHNAESYVPTDGSDSIYGEGGIHQVGASMAAALKEIGVTVIHDQTLHLPHDRGAYRRSRATVERLMGEGLDVLFDVHRDAAPMRVYAAEIEDEWVTQIQLVVGRQNPNMAVNRQFALDLKNTADQIQPGLIKGIFMARGDYNQDMAPTNLLLEVGAHQNTRNAAEKGIALFSGVVTHYFYGPEAEALDGGQASPGPGVGPDGQPRRGPGALLQPATRAANRNIFAMLALVAATGISFVVLNSRNMDDVRLKLVPYLDKLRPYTEKPDRFLAGLQQSIQTAGEAIQTKIRTWLAEGDRFLLPLQEKIYTLALRAKQRLR
jgi:stage II sporulation protein P